MYTAQLLERSKGSLPYLLLYCTKSKPHNTDGTSHNCYGDQHQSALPVALTVSPKVQTAHHTITRVTNSQSVLIVALLH